MEPSFAARDVRRARRMASTPTIGRRRARAFCAVAATAWLAACAPRSRFVVPGAVAPGRPLTSNDALGRLVIYTADDVVDSNDSEHPKHDGYSIYAEGRRVREVDNQVGPFGEDAETVTLPAGTYDVDARALNFGPVRVRAVVRAGRTTVVHLDADSDSRATDTASVRLPDGQFVGTRAD
ncbi:MAG TPA: hypothetical protein VFD92_04180 [Candidatus Binatia bacterium]|nr:hypothetical protein [Candidatus Binatia bacterium]